MFKFKSTVAAVVFQVAVYILSYAGLTAVELMPPTNSIPHVMGVYAKHSLSMSFVALYLVLVYNEAKTKESIFSFATMFYVGIAALSSLVYFFTR